MGSRLSMMAMLLLVSGAMVICRTPARAGGIALPANADLSISAYVPVSGNGPTVGKLTLTLHPFPKARMVETPTNPHEIGPWAKANLGIPIPFDGDRLTLIRPSGAGVTEQVRLGSIGPSVVRAGFGYMTETKWSWIITPIDVPLN